MTGFVSRFNKFMESAHTRLDPVYAEEKKQRNEILTELGMYATASLVASVTFGVVGFALTSSGGGISKVVGTSLTVMSLPTGFLAFNLYKISQNFVEINKNPDQYSSLTVQNDPKKIKAKLKEGTILFDSVIEYYIDTINDPNNKPFIANAKHLSTQKAIDSMNNRKNLYK